MIRIFGTAVVFSAKSTTRIAECNCCYGLIADYFLLRLMLYAYKASDTVEGLRWTDARRTKWPHHIHFVKWLMNFSGR